MGIGAPELIILLVVVLLLFGATRLPKLARSLGQASKEFKKGVSEDPKDDEPKALGRETRDPGTKEAQAHGGTTETNPASPSSS